MHSPVCLLTPGIEQCIISGSNGCRLTDCIMQFPGPKIIVPQKWTKQSCRTVLGYKYTLLERKLEVSFPGLHNAILVMTEFGPRLTRFTDGEQKSNMTLNA